METQLLEGQKAIELGAKLINSGDVVIFPTETVYGLGADAFNVEAVKKIYKGNKAIQEKKAVKKAQDLAKKPIQLKVKKSKYRVDD